MNLPDHKTKIVCTIGPASHSREVMERMMLAGMNIARLNFSYGVYPVFEAEHPEEWDSFVRGWLESHQLSGDLAIVTEGPSTRCPQAHHRMEIIDLRVRREK